MSHCEYPCPCGYHPSARCTCSEGIVRRYQKRISGPMMDRIDIHLEVASVEVEKLAGLSSGEPSSMICQRVEAARAIQQARFDKLNKPGIRCNDDMGPGEVQEYCVLDKESRAMMRLAVERMGLSAGVSSCVEVEPHDCRLGGERTGAAGAFGRGVAVPAAECYVRQMNLFVLLTFLSKRSRQCLLWMYSDFRARWGAK